MASGEFSSGLGTVSQEHTPRDTQKVAQLACALTHPRRSPTATLGCPVPTRYLLPLLLSMSVNVGHVSIPNSNALLVKKSSWIFSLCLSTVYFLSLIFVSFLCRALRERHKR